MIYEERNGEKVINFSKILLKQLPENFHTPYSVDTRGSDINQLPSGLIIGGNLYINKNIDKIPEDIIVCGYIFIESSTTIIPNNLLVGGEILGVLKGDSHRYTFKNFEKTDKYIYINYKLIPIFYSFNLDEQTKIYKSFENDRILEYTVPNKYNLYSFYNDVNKAKEILSYCRAVARGLWDLHYTETESISIPTAARIYKVCTGACDDGINDFIKNLKSPKESYTIEEVIELTEGYYINHNVLKNYFIDKKPLVDYIEKL